MYISIHVPTRGTTETPFGDMAFETISIHVPTRGTTGVVNTVDGGKRYFNPRPHEGDDWNVCSICKDRFYISIHVPTRGTTAILTNFQHPFL